MKKARILVLFDTDGDPPVQQDYRKQLESSEEAEFDVARALMGRGHEVRLLGFRSDLYESSVSSAAKLFLPQKTWILRLQK